jgi:hypothetical protein
MIDDSQQSSYTAKLGIREFDDLFSNSSLFPNDKAQLNSFRSREAEDVLKAECSLYSLAQGSKLQIPALPTKRKRKEKVEDNAGKDWFYMKTPEITPEIKEDLQAIMLRRHMDPKRFYKKSDMKEAPKFFQIGTVMNAPDEPKRMKVEKEKKGKSLVEQMLEDDEKLSFSKKKWLQVMKSKPKKRSSSRQPKAHKKRKLGFR